MPPETTAQANARRAAARRLEAQKSQQRRKSATQSPLGPARKAPTRAPRRQATQPRQPTPVVPARRADPAELERLNKALSGRGASILEIQRRTQAEAAQRAERRKSATPRTTTTTAPPAALGRGFTEAERKALDDALNPQIDSAPLMPQATQPVPVGQVIQNPDGSVSFVPLVE